MNECFYVLPSHFFVQDIVEMRKSPIPAPRQTLGRPESQERSRSPAPVRPPRPVSNEPSPQPSPKPPPRPPSLRLSQKGTTPPPRPPPPSKKSDKDSVIEQPKVSHSDREIFIQAPYAVEKNPFSDQYSQQSLSPVSSRGSDRGSFKSSAPYDPSLNPFGEEDEDEEDNDNFEYENVNFIQSPPGPDRASINPFFTASIKRKPAPSPPKPNEYQSLESNPSARSFDQDQKPLPKISNIQMEKQNNVSGVTPDLSVTSGETNEKLSDAEAPPVIVSVCLE